jgi:hypothetical protein
MVKPRLPPEIQAILPSDVIHIIQSFVPHLPPTPKPSPSLQRELQKIQKTGSNNAMYLKGFDDFILD